MRPIDADKLVEKMMMQVPGQTYRFCYPCKDILEEIKKAPAIGERQKGKDMMYIITFITLTAFQLLWAYLTRGGRRRP